MRRTRIDYDSPYYENDENDPCKTCDQYRTDNDGQKYCAGKAKGFCPMEDKNYGGEARDM